MTEFFEKLDNLGNTELEIIGIMAVLLLFALGLLALYIKHSNRYR